MLKEYGHLLPNVQQVLSIYTQDYVKKPLAFDIDFAHDDLVVTFDGLVKDTAFIKQIKLMQSILEEKLGTPVDIEFASDGEDFYLLQCRPQSFSPATVRLRCRKICSPGYSIFGKRYISKWHN